MSTSELQKYALGFLLEFLGNISSLLAGSEPKLLETTTWKHLPKKNITLELRDSNLGPMVPEAGAILGTIT